MTLNELLSSPEVKKMYKELSKKYHPDTNTGDTEIMKRINKAKEDGDAKMKALYKELMGDEKNKEKKQNSSKQFNKIKEWCRKIAKEIPSIMIIIPRHNDNGSIYINIRTIDEGDYILFDGIKYNSKEQLKNSIMSKIVQ